MKVTKRACKILSISKIDQLTKGKNSKKYKTGVESVQLGNTHIADMDKCPQDKCCPDKCHGDSCNLFYMFPGPFV